MFEWETDRGIIKILYRPESKSLTFTVGGRDYEVPKNDLHAVAFIIANEEQQEGLVPVKTREVRVFEKQVKIKANKHMKPGDLMVASVKFTVPLEILVKETGNKILIPK